MSSGRGKPAGTPPRREEAASSKAPREARLSHLDDAGQAHMVDVTGKADTGRVAIARGRIIMQPGTMDLLRAGGVAKGDVLSVARVAGIMAAKQTSQIIPLCHPLLLTGIEVEFSLSGASGKNGALASVEITAMVRTSGKTGVEMEAMTAVAVSALTIYDMCKAVDRGMRIEGVRLARKSGGKSGDIVLE